MGLNKFCCRCNAIIGYRDKYCIDCQSEIDRVKKEKFDTYLRCRKANGEDKEVYKKYKNNRIDEREQRFYNSKEWKQVRDNVISIYKYIDIYAYYKYTEVIPATCIHHIVEIKKDWELRLDKNNLISLSDKSHLEIHRRLRDDEKEVIKELKEMLERFKREFNINC